MQWADEEENIKEVCRNDSPEENNHEIQPTNLQTLKLDFLSQYVYNHCIFKYNKGFPDF